VGTIRHRDLQNHWTELTGLVLPKAGGIAVEQVTHRFWIFLSVSETFVAEFEVDQNRAKFCMFLVPKIFFGKTPPKFWTNIIKLGLVLTIVQNFTPVGQHISEITRGKKNRNLGQSPTWVHPAP